MNSTRLFFLSALVVVVLDQLSKFIVTRSFPYTTNTGAAFGILQGQQLLLIVISFLVICFLLYYRKDYPLALGFLLGGTIGNLIDRLLLGYVIDFIDVGFWPIFNIADSFNTIGVGLLLLVFFREQSKLM